MKPSTIVLLCLSTVPLAIAQETAPLGSPPSLEIESREIDFGTLARGSEAIAEIELSNRGGRPLQILEVVSGCGCTVVDAPSEIPRGESAILRMTVDTTGLDEQVLSGVTLTTNDPRNKMVHIRLRAELLMGIELLPTRSLQMRAGRGTAALGQLVVRRLPGVEGELALDGLASDRPWLQATAYRVEAPAAATERLPALEPGDWVVETRLTGEPIRGPGEAFVTFDTGLEQEPRAGFPVRVAVRRAINVEPETLTLSSTGDAPVRGEVLVAVRADLAEWPLTAAIEAPGFTATPAEAGARYYKVAIEWDPSVAGAVREASLTLSVGGESVTVPVSVDGS